MMMLFGGFSDRVFEAYDEVHPRSDGWQGRVALWQLYPLLAHVCMFGRGYGASLAAALEDALRGRVRRRT
jgi:fructosamine-3-kinase